MEDKIIDLKEYNKQETNLNENIYDYIPKDKLEKAASVINDGGLVLFPTETVYGIGADGLNSDAVSNIFIAKGRAQDNPLILHVSNMDMIKRITKNINELEMKLINRFMPGPFTIVLDRADIVPDRVTGGLNTVGVRMPSNVIARALIETANTPIAAPSANISGRPSGTNVNDIFEELNDKVDYIIDGGDTFVGLESTVVRVCDDKVRILRPGRVTKEELEEVCEVIVDENILSKLTNDKPVMSPGMKYRHYAPKSNCILVYSDDYKKLTNEMINQGKNFDNIVYICTKENEEELINESINLSNDKNKNIHTLIAGSKDNLDEIGKNIFSLLRQVDKYNPDIVIVEGVTTNGFGLAIMNRLIRACSHNYVEV